MTLNKKFVIVFSIIIIGIIMLWNWRLKKEIIQREESEKTLLENEAFIKAVMDNLPMGIAVNSVDPTVNFNYMNDNFPKYYRTTRQKLADLDIFWESVYEDPIFREEIKKTILNDCASGEHHHNQNKDRHQVVQRAFRGFKGGGQSSGEIFADGAEAENQER